LENPVVLLGQIGLMEMEEDFEEIQLADFIVAVGVEHVKGHLQEQVALAEELDEICLVLIV